MGAKTKYLSLYTDVKARYPQTYVNEIDQSQGFDSSTAIVLIDNISMTPIASKDASGYTDDLTIRIHVINKEYKVAYEAAEDLRTFLNEYSNSDIYTCHFESMTPIDDTELEVKRFALDFIIN